ncbi:VWA domain-containing protein [Amycolatopsis sp. Hca4]|uniref:vWA domain-containing protein n=1 Tax=Amycolatopsis sp. Hca4 TaxID=2742131 RepID=UPI00158FA8C7|nr:VWA domain-containing protein [Amycolatopsis sp. Hca4]QKV75295.1 VWA domain-containing protein [Amycolatopsis sp. Hca4]
MLLPVYLVCDLSASMKGGGRVQALQDALTALRDSVWLNPVISDTCRIGVLGFAGSAWTVVPLCDVAALDELPALTTAGLTNYGSAFRLLRETIEGDVAQLAGDGFRVWRPIVFFVSDGEPTDTRELWRAELARLVDPGFPVRPEIVAFAVGEAAAGTLSEIATARCFAATDGTAVQEAIAGIGDMVIRSVVASGTGGGPMIPPTPPDGFEEVDLL